MVSVTFVVIMTAVIAVTTVITVVTAMRGPLSREVIAREAGKA